MRALFWLLGLTALAVGLAVAARYNDGFVLIQLSPWRIELSLNFFVFLLLVLFGIGYVLLRLAINAMRMPSMVQAYRERKRQERAMRALGESVRLLYEGRFGHAVKQAQSAYEGNQLPGLAALVAARAARGLREEQRETEWLERARGHDADVRNARLMTEAEIALDRRDFDLAAQRLSELLATGPKHVAALRLALRAHLGRQAWMEALRVVRLLEKHRALTHDQAAPLLRRAHLGNIGARSGDGVALADYWRAVQGRERDDTATVLALVKAMIAAGEGAAAQKIIEARLADAWDPTLLSSYADCGTSPMQRLARAEDWLKAQPRDAQLLLMLGRLCLQSQLWGKAQSYLEASIALGESRAAHTELASLFDRLERPEDANRHYRAAVRVGC